MYKFILTHTCFNLMFSSKVKATKKENHEGCVGANEHHNYRSIYLSNLSGPLCCTNKTILCGSLQTEPPTTIHMDKEAVPTASSKQ